MVLQFPLTLLCYMAIFKSRVMILLGPTMSQQNQSPRQWSVIIMRRTRRRAAHFIYIHMFIFVLLFIILILLYKMHFKSHLKKMYGKQWTYTSKRVRARQREI